MKTKLMFVAVTTGAHFLLWWLAMGFWAFGFLQLISYPLISISDASWPPFNWFIFILKLVLNSSIWGVCIGLLLYAVRCRFHKPVEYQVAGVSMKRSSRITLFGIASGLLWSLVAIFYSARTPESFMLFPIAGIIAGVLMCFALYRPVRRFSRWAILLFGILMLPVGAFCFGACTSLLLTAGRFISGGGISFGDAFLGPLYSGMIYAYGAIIVSVFSMYGLILFPSAVITTYLFHLVVLHDGTQTQSVSVIPR